MRSAKAKVLHEVAGLPLVQHVVRSARDAGAERICVVVGRDAASVTSLVSKQDPEIRCFEQSERLGTAHAVLAARETIAEGWDDIVVLFGDTPLVRAETLAAARETVALGAAICVVGFRPSDPFGYGRLLLDGNELVAIREHRDASEAERNVDLCNAGVMVVSGSVVLELLDAVRNHNAKGEYYLTDIVGIARERNLPLRMVEAPAEDVLGVNTRVELAAVEAVWQARARRRAMLDGVTLQAPDTVFFSHDTRVGPDTVIEPHVVFGPGVRIEARAHVHGFSHLEGTTVESDASVGPFARLRPGTVVGKAAKVGNFVETKNVDIGAHAKVSHLTYLGDASIGTRTNVGAGTITCNYDGYNKYRTTIGHDAFIGSNSSLVAPVRIGDGAYVGSGSVVTQDVPDEALALGRARQVIKEGRGRAINERNRARKADRSG